MSGKAERGRATLGIPERGGDTRTPRSGREKGPRGRTSPTTTAETSKAKRGGGKKVAASGMERATRRGDGRPWEDGVWRGAERREP